MKCQVCGSTNFLVGPSGGLATNVECVRYGTRYNSTPFGLELLGMKKRVRVHIVKTGEDRFFSSYQEASAFVRSQPDAGPFRHQYYLYDEDGILCEDM